MCGNARIDTSSSVRPESESGERAVPLPPIVVNTLREWTLACPKSDLDLVFPSKFGRVETSRDCREAGPCAGSIAAGVTVTGTDKDGARRAKYTGLHSLRHFYASWCINRRTMAVSSCREGRSGTTGPLGISMTTDVYGHLFPRGDDAAELAAAEKSLLG